MNAKTTSTTSTTSTNTNIECWCCGTSFSADPAVQAESNRQIYGRRLGSDYCRGCVLDFVENEIADGVRHPDGTRIR
jgi:Pyruvate/2-oxoacid:ferredoxin oxidoreductase delta subunit